MKEFRKNFIIIFVVFLFVFYPAALVLAESGDNALFTFEPLNGKEGENEVKLVLNTDSAQINHLIFDIVDPLDDLLFDISVGSTMVGFPLNGNAILGTQTLFTTSSGDLGYDISSSNPADVGSFSSLNFATLIADKDQPSGLGGILSFDTDTAIYVNAQRRGNLGPDYEVLPNVSPYIDMLNEVPTVDGVSLVDSVVAPSLANPVPENLLRDVSVTPTFFFKAIDDTDASVQRKLNLYKRLDDEWVFSGSPSNTVTSNRSGSNMTFSSTLSGGNALEFSTYYKLKLTVTDDQGASTNNVFYFSTEADNVAPSAVPVASMTFLSDSDDRSDVISQISFTASFDNDSVANYYLWTKNYLKEKDIINADGSRNLALDLDFDETVSDEEFNIALRELVDSQFYVVSLNAASAGSSPKLTITGDDVDKIDDNGTPLDDADDLYLVPDSLARDILYVVAADNASTIDSMPVSNFSDFRIVEKYGDVFGSEIDLNVQGGTYSYIVGDGSLDVWDSIYIYRNIIGRTNEFPMLRPDFVHSSQYQYPANLSVSSANLIH